MKDKEKKRFEFRVVDNKTGKEADTYEIALKEDWAKGLIYCDMEGFAILEDGNLVLLDECGKWEYCPSGRFEIIPEDSVALSREEYEKLKCLEKCFDYALVQERKQIRKETAEKMISEAIAKVKERFKKTKGYTSCYDIVITLMEIAKQFGVEIKE